MTGLGWNKYLLRDGCRRKAAAEKVMNICDPTVIDKEQGTLLYHEIKHLSDARTRVLPSPHGVGTLELPSTGAYDVAR